MPQLGLCLLLGSYRLILEIGHLHLTCFRGTKQRKYTSDTPSNRTLIMGLIILLLKFLIQGLPIMVIGNVFVKQWGIVTSYGLCFFLNTNSNGIMQTTGVINSKYYYFNNAILGLLRFYI